MKKALLRIWIRWRVAGGEPLPTWLRRVCERDADLQRELEAERALSGRLGKDVREEARMAAPVGSVERALSAARREQGGSQPVGTERGRGSWRPRLALAAVGAMALAAALVLFDGGVESEDDQPLAAQPDETRQEADAAPLAFDVKEVLDTDWKNPLDQEFEYLLADGKRAVDFLIGNFSPERKERG